MKIVEKNKKLKRQILALKKTIKKSKSVDVIINLQNQIKERDRIIDELEGIMP